MDLDTVGARVKYAIRESGQTQATVARYIGCKSQAVNQWISGQTKHLRPENLFQLAEITGFEARWIATGKGPLRPMDKYAVENIRHVVSVMEKMPPYAQKIARKLVDDVKDLPPRDNMKDGIET
jgi:transcriptional regulator with XRE-family HTH domain